MILIMLKLVFETFQEKYKVKIYGTVKYVPYIYMEHSIEKIVGNIEFLKTIMNNYFFIVTLSLINIRLDIHTIHKSIHMIIIVYRNLS